MIFSDLIEEAMKLILPEFEKLLELALKNQKHPGDLLLLAEHGFYNTDHVNWREELKKSTLPYMIGPGLEGHAEQQSNSFIYKYLSIQQPIQKTHAEYRASLAYTPETVNERDKRIQFEANSIEIEMMLYLKMWESELFIKRMTLLTGILNGKGYDWGLTIKRDYTNKDGKEIRELREKLGKNIKRHSELFFLKFNLAFSRKLRNGIAHSTYFFAGDVISFLNEDDKDTRKSISFAEWTEIFHISVSIQQGYLGFLRQIHDYYKEEALKNGNKIAIQIADGNNARYSKLVYDQVSDRWRFS